MKIVYIRHADKEYKNMGAEIYKHDPGITKRGAEKARDVALNLVKKYGEPTEIKTSPFRRCRETGIEMASVLKEYKELIVDKDLSEFLGNHKDTELDVTISTKIYNPPHPESFEDMKNRVYKHVQKTKKVINKREVKGNEGVVWFVTHGLIIKQIANIFGIAITKSPRYLNSLCIYSDNDRIYAELIMFKEDVGDNRDDRDSKDNDRHSKDNRDNDRYKKDNSKESGKDKEREEAKTKETKTNSDEKFKEKREKGTKSWKKEKVWVPPDREKKKNWSKEGISQEMVRKNFTKILSK